MADQDNGRTHEPSLRELTSELDGLRELVLARIMGQRELIDERDRLYKERDESRRTAVDAALAAVKEQTRASFEASEKAIVKAEDSQREYNVRSNEFRGQLDDQAKLLMSRSEALGIGKAFEDKLAAIKTEVDKNHDRVMSEIRTLSESRVKLGGHREGSIALWGFICTAIVLLGTLATLAAMLMKAGRT